MLLTKEVEIKIRKDTCNHYRGKGYDCNIGDIITVRTSDLPIHSGIKVQYKCDYPDCEEIITLRYEDYYKKRERKYASLGDFCNRHNKEMKTKWMKQNEPEAYKNDYKNRQEKIIKTCQEKYNCNNPMQNEDVKNVLKNSMVEKYGVENPMQVHKFREKLHQTLIENNPELELVEQKDGRIYYKKNGIPCSKNQKYISELYNGKINEYINGYYIDILLQDKIYFEYDGSGHDLGVKMGKITEEEFKNKEIKRYYILKNKGYKQISFISKSKRKLPSDEVLLNIKEISIEYLKSKDENHWIEFNFDENKIRIKGKEISYNFKDKISIEKLI